MNAFFLGAGASRGTLCKSPNYPPTAAEFGRELCSRVSNWQTEYRHLRGVAKCLKKPLAKLDLESIWTFIDYYDKLWPTLPPPPWRKRGAAVPDIKRALLRLYGRNCDRASDKLPKSAKYTLGRLIGNEVKPGDIVISFNYDTLLERLARKFGRPLRSYCGDLQSDVINFAKPHGSTPWCLDLKKKSVTWMRPSKEPLLRSLDEHEIRSEREPLLLGAVPIKSELIEEVQFHYGVHDVFKIVMGQWEAVVKAIEKADVIVVVGYSFPKEDQYGRFLLREGARRRGKPLKIEYYERPDRAAERAFSIQEAFQTTSRGPQLDWCGQVEAP
jgi:hypothetical protein